MNDRNEFKISDNLLIFKDLKFKMGNKLGMFDLDYTIIKPKSGKKFPVDSNDWKYMYSTTKKRIQYLYKKGYSIVIISNQNGLGDIKSLKLKNFCHKIYAISKDLNIPFTLYASIKSSIYRKPSPGIFYKEIVPKIDNYSDKSFYCGDAGGRPNDFSDSDIEFAFNCFTVFFTPEEIFLGSKRPDTLKKIHRDPPPFIQNNIFRYKRDSKMPELIFMFGYPGSGKSTIVKILMKLHNFTVASNDIHKGKFASVVRNTLALKNDLVIDNTNLSLNARKKVFDMLKRSKKNYYVRCFVINTTIDQCKHNNMYRAYCGDKELIPMSAYNFMKRSYSYPQENEGFNSIEEINYDPLLDFTYGFCFV